MADTPETYHRDESYAQRLDRNFNEQLQEVRIAQAGVQILFAFLLTLPFQSRFHALSAFQLDLYVVTLVAAAVAVILFTAPVAIHRVLFRGGVKDFIVTYTSVLTSIGLGALAICVLGGVILVLDVLVSLTAALVVGAILSILIVVLWLVIPERHRRVTEPRLVNPPTAPPPTD